MTNPTSSRFSGAPAQRLSIFLSVLDQVRRHSISLELLQRAHRTKLSGITIFQGLEGFGTSGRIHQPRLLVQDAPLVVVVVETPVRIDSFLAEVGHELLGNSLVVISDLEILNLLPP
jgi:uncharacterized protein